MGFLISQDIYYYMKKTLTEELQRIHEITYGKKVVNENFVNNLLNKIGLGKDKGVKKIDDPKKADLVTPDVADFYKSIENASKSGGLSQKSKGSMNYQKEVESLQIGLLILGYQLPKYGVDGLFGPETASAVTKFKKDQSILNESADSLRDDLDALGYKEKGSELTSGGPVKDVLTDLVSDILKSYKQTNPDVTVTLTSGNDKFHKTLKYVSTHTQGSAIDLTISPYNTKNASDFIKILNALKSKDSKFSYIDEYTRPSGAATGGHFHLQYGGSSSTSGGSSTGGSMVTASPEMLNKLLEMLKSKGVKSEELKSYIDSVTTGGGAEFTDLDLTTEQGVNAYSQICQKFIDSKGANPLGITGKMMAEGAKQAFERYKKYVPAELALSQLVLEGGIGNKDPNSKPIRTKNPFNVGNVDSGEVVQYGQVQTAINTYYNLIAKSYLGKGKTAKDLLGNFVNNSGNRYASAVDYESKLNKLASQVSSISKPIVASSKKLSYLGGYKTT
jgi:peptidoglycan hydrolase-like protein with peptidoglycan-binding domain